MKRNVSVSAKCPYYKCEERSEIFCRGPVDQTSIHLAFAIPLEKKQYMKDYCKNIDGCRNCVIWKAMVEAGR